MTSPIALRALSAAHAVALKARVGTLDGREVDRLVGYVADRLAEDDPVRAMVAHFADQRRAVLGDRDAMADIGADLQRQVIRLLWPQPLNRSDVNG